MITIAACLKSCTRTDVPLRLQGHSAVKAEGGGPTLPDPRELAPLLTALALKSEGAQVVALSVGPPEWEPLLRHALALGADDALRVWDEALARQSQGTSTTAARAAAAAAALAPLQVDWVLCSDKSADTGQECFGALLAHRLGAAFAHRVVEITPGKPWQVRAKLERGYTQQLELQAPAVLTTEGETTEPPYPSLPNWLAAQARPLTVLKAGGEKAFLPPSRIILRLPRPRVKPQALPAAGLDAEARIQTMVALPPAKRGELLDAGHDSASQARYAARFLRKRGYL